MFSAHTVKLPTISIIQWRLYYQTAEMSFSSPTDFDGESEEAAFGCKSLHAKKKSMVDVLKFYNTVAIGY